MVEVRFVTVNAIEGVKCTLDGVVKYTDSLGLCSFIDVAQGSHSYSVEKEGMHVVEGKDPFGRPLGDSGMTVIEWALVPDTPWPEDQPWIMEFTLAEGEVPGEASEILGKVGAVVSTAGLFGIILDSARKT